MKNYARAVNYPVAICLGNQYEELNIFYLIITIAFIFLYRGAGRAAITKQSISPVLANTYIHVHTCTYLIHGEMNF